MIIYYSHTGQMFNAIKDATEIEIRAVKTKEELASSILEGIHPVSVLINLDELNDEWEAFLSSLKKTFPFLPVYLILPQVSMGKAREKGYNAISLNEQALTEALRTEIAPLHDMNRRKHHRFDWPLMGRLEIPGELKRSFKVRMISSTGAFLESDTIFPEPEKRGTINIKLHDFYLLSGFKIVGKRDKSGELPAGFGIEFTDLTPTSRSIIEEIVEDELMHSLLIPDEPSRPPSIAR